MTAGIIIVLTTLYGLFKYNQPVAKTGNRSIDFEVNSIELFREFENDETASNEKYLDKVLQVQGEIIDIQLDHDGSVGVVLDGSGILFGVSCRFDPADANEIKHFRPGMTATVKGVCTGMLSDVVMIRCVLINDKH